ncbi:MAG: hypothetical protein Q9160_001153 [Pyrenula sp. 1 TL-2023]
MPIISQTYSAFRLIYLLYEPTVPGPINAFIASVLLIGGWIGQTSIWTNCNTVSGVETDKKPHNLFESAGQVKFEAAYPSLGLANRTYATKLGGIVVSAGFILVHGNVVGPYDIGEAGAVDSHNDGDAEYEENEDKRDGDRVYGDEEAGSDDSHGNHGGDGEDVNDGDYEDSSTEDDDEEDDDEGDDEDDGDGETEEEDEEEEDTEYDPNGDYVDEESDKSDDDTSQIVPGAPKQGSTSFGPSSKQVRLA